MPILTRAAKGSKINIAEMDFNLTGLQDRIISLENLAASGGGAPVALSASTTLTEASHANRSLDSTAAGAISFTLPATAPTGTKFFGTNLGAGALTLLLNGGGAVPRNALLPPTVDQFSAWEVRRHANGWVQVA